MRALLPGLLCVPILAAAAPITILKQEIVHEVQPDGTWITEGSSTIRINEQSAVASQGQQPVSYSSSMQEVEILEAYTTTKDGRRIDVPADKILTQSSPASVGAPSFNDYKIRTIVYPQLEVGATVTSRIRLKQLKPFLPGVFTMRNVFPVTVETEAASITLRAPDNVHLAVSARDLQAAPVDSTTSGVRQWRWTHRNVPATLAEPGSLLLAEFSPGLLISNLPDYPALAAAYMAGAGPAAKVTPAVQKLAAQITDKITGKRAQAEALYNWVGTNVRYVAIAMGSGGFVPHTADQVIEARYGDCKDKTTLLTALLNAQGIRAMPVLINAGASYTLPEQPVISAFDHLITYLPEFELFVDSTSGIVPFGTLMGALRDKPALATGDAGMQPVVLRTPPLDIANDRAVSHTVAVLAADGTVTGNNRIELFGADDPGARGTFGRVPEDQKARLVQQLLGSRGQQGEAKLVTSDLQDLRQPAWVSFEFKLPARINLPGPGALPTNYGIQLASPNGFVTSTMRQARKLPFACPAGFIDEVIELTLPEGMRITALPDAADLTNDFGHFRARYEVKGQQLRIQRQLETKRPRAVCTAADYAQLQAFATAINQHMRKQILYQ